MKFFRKILPLRKTGLEEIFSVNRFIWVLILSALSITFGFSLIEPIFAVFITEQIAGGSLTVVGLASMIFLATTGLVRIPAGYWIDKRGDKGGFYAIFFGGSLLIVVPLLYLFANEPWHIYLLQFLNGLGVAIDSPGWYSLFTRHIDKGREGFEWSLQATLEDLGGAVAAVTAGIVAERLGFKPIFLGVSFFTFIAIFSLLLFYKTLKLKR